MLNECDNDNDNFMRLFAVDFCEKKDENDTPIKKKIHQRHNFIIFNSFNIIYFFFVIFKKILI